VAVVVLVVVVPLDKVIQVAADRIITPTVAVVAVKVEAEPAQLTA
jgi:hypothetical protein